MPILKFSKATSAWLLVGFKQPSSHEYLELSSSSSKYKYQIGSDLFS